MPQAPQIAFIAEPNLTFGSRFLQHFVPAEWGLIWQDNQAVTAVIISYMMKRANAIHVKWNWMKMRWYAFCRIHIMTAHTMYWGMNMLL